MMFYEAKAIKTIEDAESILRNKYNIDSFVTRPESDKEYFIYLLEIIMKKEDENIFSILKKLWGLRCQKSEYICQRTM